MQVLPSTAGERRFGGRQWVALVIAITLATILNLAVTQTAWSQLGIDGANQLGKAPVIPFPQALSEWNQVDQQLATVEQQYRATTDVNAREQYRGQFLQLRESARNAVERLRKSGMAAYELAPNANPDVTMKLLGILSNDVRSDDYFAAAYLANFLYEKGCNDPTFWDLAGKAAYCTDDFEGAQILLQKAKQIGAIDDAGNKYFNELPNMMRKWQDELAIREREKAANDLPRVLLRTSKGDIWLELFENEAPQTMGNFISLVGTKFYNGKTFHRVIAGFMAQGGCPEGKGSGGAGYRIPDEYGNPNRRNHFMGALAMATAEQPNTASSQFYITFRACPHLDGSHTVFGRVISGFDVLSRLERVDVNANPNSRLTPDYIVEAIVKRTRPGSIYQPTKIP